MLRAIEETLHRWSEAGLIDAATAERILRYEGEREQPSGLRWQVMLALIFGAILLAAGIALFVAAHWDQLSPLSRFVVVLATLIVIHLIALLVDARFHWLAIALHGVGTLAAGAAIALVGQIFNIQEHWPAGVFLWALCALAGWWLLGDQVQQTIVLLLLPAWIVCEWIARTDGYRGSELMSIRMIAVIAAVYLTAFLGSQRKLVGGVLFAAGAIALAGDCGGPARLRLLARLGNHSRAARSSHDLGVGSHSGGVPPGLAAKARRPCAHCGSAFGGDVTASLLYYV